MINFGTLAKDKFTWNAILKDTLEKIKGNL